MPLFEYVLVLLGITVGYGRGQVASLQANVDEGAVSRAVNYSLNLSNVAVDCQKRVAPVAEKGD
jgi:hypothetical protein